MAERTRQYPREHDTMITGFKMLKSHSPTGIEAIVRTALRILNANAAVVLEVNYQIVGGNQHCVAIVFEVPTTRVEAAYGELDGLEEPKESGTMIRRKDGSSLQG